MLGASSLIWERVIIAHAGRLCGGDQERLSQAVRGHAYVEEQTFKAIRAARQVLHFLSAIAAVLSPFLLFLMALGLRLKFHMSV